MKLVVRKRALKALLAVAQWVEDQNTEGAGDRWLDKVFAELNRRAKAKVKNAPCSNELLKKRHYRCFTYHENWVVAYKIEKNSFLVCRFIWAGKIQ